MIRSRSILLVLAVLMQAMFAWGGPRRTVCLSDHHPLHHEQAAAPAESCTCPMALAQDDHCPHRCCPCPHTHTHDGPVASRDARTAKNSIPRTATDPGAPILITLPARTAGPSPRTHEAFSRHPVPPGLRTTRILI